MEALTETPLERQAEVEPPEPPPAPARRRRIALAGAAAFVPAAALLAAWIEWVPTSGGYFPRDWYPVALALVALWAVLAIGRGRALPPGRAPKVALGLLAALVAWSFLSMTWAPWPGHAWEAANELLLFLAGAAIVSITPWGTRSAMAFLGIWSVGVTTALAITLASAASTGHIGSYLIDQQFASPIGYSNGTSSVAVLVAIVAIVLASRPRAHPLVSGALTAATAFLVAFAFIPESRGALGALAVTLPLLVALTPNRVRLITRGLIVAGAVAISAGPAFAVYRAAVQQHPVEPVVKHAASVIALCAGAVFVATVLLGFAERVVEPRVPRPAGARRAGRIALAAGGALLVVLLVVNAGTIGHQVKHRWNTFRNADVQVVDRGQPRITDTVNDPKRYDAWRVAYDAFRGAQFHGIGAGNYESAYNVHRRFPKYSRYAHSLPLRVLAEGGLVAGIGFVALLLALAIGLGAAYRRLDSSGRALLAACAAVSFCFVQHASLDWLDELPALAAPALALPFLALRLGRRERWPAHRRERIALPRAVAPVVVTTLAVAALVSLALPYLSLRYLERAYAHANNGYAPALADAKRAASLDPLSAAPEMAKGYIALAYGDRGGARTAFQSAMRREPSWLPQYELALLDSLEGRFSPAQAEIARAHALTPQDPVVSEAQKRIHFHERLDPLHFADRVSAAPLYRRRGFP